MVYISRPACTDWSCLTIPFRLFSCKHNVNVLLCDSSVTSPALPVMVPTFSGAVSLSLLRLYLSWSLHSVVLSRCHCSGSTCHGPYIQWCCLVVIAPALPVMVPTFSGAVSLSLLRLYLSWSLHSVVLSRFHCPGSACHGPYIQWCYLVVIAPALPVMIPTFSGAVSLSLLRLCLSWSLHSVVLSRCHCADSTCLGPYIKWRYLVAIAPALPVMVPTFSGAVSLSLLRLYLSWSLHSVVLSRCHCSVSTCHGPYIQWCCLVVIAPALPVMVPSFSGAISLSLLRLYLSWFLHSMVLSRCHWSDSTCHGPYIHWCSLVVIAPALPVMVPTFSGAASLSLLRLYLSWSLHSVVLSRCHCSGSTCHGPYIQWCCLVFIAPALPVMVPTFSGAISLSLLRLYLSWSLHSVVLFRCHCSGSTCHGPYIQWCCLVVFAPALPVMVPNFSGAISLSLLRLFLSWSLHSVVISRCHCSGSTCHGSYIQWCSLVVIAPALPVMVPTFSGAVSLSLLRLYLSWSLHSVVLSRCHCSGSTCHGPYIQWCCLVVIAPALPVMVPTFSGAASLSLIRLYLSWSLHSVVLSRCHCSGSTCHGPYIQWCCLVFIAPALPVIVPTFSGAVSLSLRRLYLSWSLH